MAVETGAIFKRLYFDGQSSGTYGVYITGEAVFSAPQRDVEMIKIPGRNGEFALDNGRFENIEVTYPAGIFADNEADFAEAISDFRNFLASRTGYCRLEDDYNPTEYRMAVYKSGLDVDAKVLKAGEFDITFDCKPQRWLKDGETAVTIGEWGETETVSGDIVSVENPNGILAVKSLEVELEPIQSGSGTPSPTNVRPISGHTSVDVIVSPTTTASDGTTYTTALGRTVYGGTLDVTSGVLTVDRAIVTFNGASGEQWEYYSVAQGNLFRHTQSDRESGPLINKSVLCNRFEVVDNAVRANGTLSSPNSGGEKYFDFIYDDCNSVATWKTWLASNNVQVVYPLATPQTYQLTAQQISLLTGDNNIWSDSGDITLEYGQNPSVLFNPTLFESSPLLEAMGSGVIQFNGYEIDFAGVPYGEIVICPDSYAFHNLSDTVTVTLDTSLLNSGDAIYPEIKDFYVIARLENSASANFLHGSIGATSNVLEAEAQPTIVKNKKQFLMYLYPDFGDGFVYGTSKTIVSSAVYNYRLSGTDYSETVGVTITYGGADTYTVKVTSTGTLPANVSRKSYALSVPTMYGDSTQPIQGVPIYIDCDLGEAYLISGTEYVSLNHRIDLGSELPKLASGSNTVTFDNTITELKVTPRYWKV